MDRSRGQGQSNSTLFEGFGDTFHDNVIETRLPTVSSATTYLSLRLFASSSLNYSVMNLQLARIQTPKVRVLLGETVFSPDLADPSTALSLLQAADGPSLDKTLLMLGSSLDTARVPDETDPITGLVFRSKTTATSHKSQVCQIHYITRRISF